MAPAMELKRHCTFPMWAHCCTEDCCRDCCMDCNCVCAESSSVTVATCLFAHVLCTIPFSHFQMRNDAKQITWSHGIPQNLICVLSLIWSFVCCVTRPSLHFFCYSCCWLLAKCCFNASCHCMGSASATTHGRMFSPNIHNFC